MTDEYRQLWEDVVKTTDKAKAVRALVEIVVDKSGRAFVLGLEPEGAKLCVEILDYGIAQHSLNTTEEKNTFFLMLRRLAECHDLLPDRLVLKEKVEIPDGILASAGSGDFRCRRYKGALVAVKTVGVPPQDDLQKIRKRLYEEVLLWQTLSHRNVLRFIGVQEDLENRQFTIASEWMMHGSIMNYIQNNRTNRLELLHGAAQGLKYIHNARLAHGGLNGESILVSNDTPPRACLADFDFLTTTFDAGQNLSCSAQLDSGAVAFMAPELMVPQEYGKDDSVPTLRADIYAFGLVIFQVLTGDVPFRGVPRPALVHSVVRDEKRPDQPENASVIGFSDSLWGFTRRCWDGQTESRPDVGEVVSHLGEAAIRWNGLMPPCAKVENVASSSVEMSDSTKYDGFFQSSPEDGFIGSQTTAGSFDPLCESSTLAAYQPSWKEVTNATSRAEAVRALAKIVVDKHGRAFAFGLGFEAAKLCVETLDYGITKCHLRSTEKGAFFLVLRRLAERHGLLPDRLRITEKIEFSDEVLAFGGFGDIRSGTYNGSVVAFKSMRVATLDNFLKIRKRFYREVVLWERLSHQNVLKLVGVWEDTEKGQFVTVAEWMEHGSIVDYIKKNEANRLDLLHGAAQGLEYIHDVGFTHGDLKGSNILVTNSTPPRACLADFGFITMAVSPGQKLSCSAQFEGGTMKFMAPELLVPEKYGKEDSIPTPQADIYAFGLVIFQVLTGETPFRDCPASAIGYHVPQGKRPDKPKNASAIGFSDSLWDFTQRCWSGDIESRPGAGEVVTCLGEAVANWDGLMPPCAPIEDVAPASKGMTDSKRYIGLFPPSLNIPSRVAPESPAESQIFSGPFNSSSSRPLRERLQEVVTKPREELRPESLAAMRPQSEKPRGDIHISPRHDQKPNPPPSQLHQKKWKGIKHIGSNILGFLGLGW